ncbi:BEM46-like protein, putative [Plasmodium malariae]|uniref:BEM46-like protein, putative n=1 Tax=Plasmodium malariae TaxID=5858 RepID=A0A1D3JLJ3_PLAMA|nr:BEM46-like protein, putative [Plasmodium malariae]SBT87472.1 BEM46-like protein, putative [Plasmodium malariae]
MYLVQDDIIFAKDKYDPAVAQKPGNNYEEVLVKTEDGYTHQCWYVKAPDHEKKPILLYFLGNGGYLELYVDLFDRIVDKVDVNIFSCTNRGCGTNDEEPSEEYFYKDANVYLNYLKQDKSRKIIVFGSSMGAAVAIEAALKNQKDIYGLIVQNTFLSMKKMAREKKPFLYFFLVCYDFLIRTKMDNEKKIKKIRSPVLFTISAKDETISPRHTQTLYETCPSKHKYLFISKDGTHNNIIISDHGEYFNSLKEFIETAIFIKDNKEEYEKKKKRKDINIVNGGGAVENLSVQDV